MYLYLHLQRGSTGVLNFGGLRIAGLSGIFKGSDYRMGACCLNLNFMFLNFFAIIIVVSIALYHQPIQKI